MAFLSNGRQPEVGHSALTLPHSCCWIVLLPRGDLPANVIEIYHLIKNAKSSHPVTVRRSKMRQLSCWRNYNGKSGKTEFQNVTILRKKWVFHFAQTVLYSSIWTKNTTTGLLRTVKGKAWNTVICYNPSLKHTVAHNCHIKTKCSQQIITNRSHQIQIAHSKFKSLTANSNRPQQIQIAHSELQITQSKLQFYNNCRIPARSLANFYCQ